MRRGGHARVTIAHYAPAFGAALCLHAGAAALAGGAFRFSPAPDEPRRDRHALVVFSLPPEDAHYPGLSAVDRTSGEWPTSPNTRGSEVNREFAYDVGKIAARAQVLFPFLTPGLALEHFTFPSARELAGPPRVHPGGERPARERDRASRALKIADAQLQRLVDKSWSRRHRWDTFAPVAKLTQAYSGDVGQLPEVMQRYCDQNSLQPFTDADIKDPRLWVQLAIAADHVDFIAFIRRYVSEHPATRTTTTLLFLLDNLAQASRDALAPLLEADPAGDLAWTRQANRDAYELVGRLKRYYQRELARRGLMGAEAITAHYERVRLGILDEILRTTPGGYRAGDALYLKGAIYWRQRQLPEALRAWRRISIDARDSHVKTYSQILLVLSQSASQRPPYLPHRQRPFSTEIDQILRNSQQQWLARAYDRLQQFGYRVDTF